MHAIDTKNAHLFLGYFIINTSSNLLLSTLHCDHHAALQVAAQHYLVNVAQGVSNSRLVTRLLVFFVRTPDACVKNKQTLQRSQNKT
jgi:hypothetical protein